MPFYYVETDMGCGIRKAKSKKQAWSQLKKAEGTNHAQRVRLATKEDIDWVKGMGGYVPED